jgi:hypothetical protein
VCSGEDALDLVAAGASAVALGTILFADPFAPLRIRAEIGAAERAGAPVFAPKSDPDAVGSAAAAIRIPI